MPLPTTTLASVAQANLYLADKPTWLALTDDQKLLLLRRASQYLATAYTWRGTITIFEQELCFPRSGIHDRENRGIQPNVIPPDIIDACCELALRGMTTALTPDELTPGAIASESKGLGPLQKSVTYLAGKFAQPRFTIVENLIAPYLAFDQFGSLRLERA